MFKTPFDGLQMTVALVGSGRLEYPGWMAETRQKCKAFIF